MIPKYILDYLSDTPSYSDSPELREERPIDKTLRPNAERYILLSDLKPHIQYILDHEPYNRDYDSHLQELFSLLNS